jgi:hypothetical protein
LFVASSVSAAEEPVYELRTYTTNPGKLPNLHKRFADHTIKLFEKHGIKNLYYWTPTDEKLKDNTLVYVIEHQSRAAAAKSWQAFINDPEWKKVARESQVDGKILAKRPESVYLKATDFSPAVKKSPEESRLFELRTYTTAEGRLPNLLKRFREGELELFTKHGLNHVLYWTPLDQKNTLVYVISHADRAAAKKSWAGFLGDPEWKKLHKASLESGPIVIKVESQFLAPTDFSPLK